MPIMKRDSIHSDIRAGERIAAVKMKRIGGCVGMSVARQYYYFHTFIVTRTGFLPIYSACYFIFLSALFGYYEFIARPLLINLSYQYEPLPQDDYIRILYIASSGLKDSISFHLLPVSLVDAPSYECLSYEWSNEVNLKPVRLYV
jgi:hypothetical protein